MDWVLDGFVADITNERNGLPSLRVSECDRDALFTSCLITSCADSREKIGPGLLERDGAMVASVPPDLVLQRPNHPQHECQCRNRWNEKHHEVEIHNCTPLSDAAF